MEGLAGGAESGGATKAAASTMDDDKAVAISHLLNGRAGRRRMGNNLRARITLCDK
jgi:hypothetical protein